MAQRPSRNLIEGGIHRFMLPGFRFLFAAIILSMSILVFGLGAAALLRAAHEEVSSNPSWRAAPETMFAQQAETARPVLAMLRVEPAAMEQKATDNVPAFAAPVEPATIDPAPAELAASASTPAEPERIAALTPEGSSQAEAAKPDILAAENPAQGEAAPVQADTPAAAGEARIASSGQAVPPATEAARTASEQISATAAADTDAASTKIATLDNPSVAIETNPPAKAASARPDRSAVKKRLQARRAKERRRLAARARVAQQPAQPPADPFAQPTITVRKR
jgi:hypothetical protein